jgi:diguanylate cyclase (GGDEF)-like protein
MVDTAELVSPISGTRRALPWAALAGMGLTGLAALAATYRYLMTRLAHEAQLHQLALTDGLTGLANRRAAVERLEQALARAARRGTPVAVLYVDVDRFKGINDRHGHAAGDAVLVEVAARLRGAFRTEDVIARLGGDEFLVACEDLTSARDTQVVAARTRDVLAAPYVVGGQTLRVTASVGIALGGADASVERLLDRADAEMYEAKATRQAFAAVADRA